MINFRNNNNNNNKMIKGFNYFKKIRNHNNNLKFSSRNSKIIKY